MAGIGDRLNPFACLPFEVVLEIFDALVRVTTWGCSDTSKPPTGVAHKAARAGAPDRGHTLITLSLLSSEWRKVYEPVLYRHVRLVGPRAAALFRSALQAPRGAERARWVRSVVLLAHWGEKMVAGSVGSQHALDVDAILFRVGPSTTHILLSPSLLGPAGSSATRAAYRLGQAKEVHLIGPDSAAERALSYGLSLHAGARSLFETSDPLAEALAGFASRQEDDLLDEAAAQKATSINKGTHSLGLARSMTAPLPPLLRRLQYGPLLALKRIELHMYTPASASALGQLSSLTHIVLSNLFPSGAPGPPGGERYGGVTGSTMLGEGGVYLSRATLHLLLSSPSLQQLVVVDEPRWIGRFIYELVRGRERREPAGDHPGLADTTDDEERQASMHEVEHQTWGKLLWRARPAPALRAAWAQHTQSIRSKSPDMEAGNDWTTLGLQWVCSDPGRPRAGCPDPEQIEVPAPWARQTNDLQAANQETLAASEELLMEYQRFLFEQRLSLK